MKLWLSKTTHIIATAVLALSQHAWAQEDSQSPSARENEIEAKEASDKQTLFIDPNSPVVASVGNIDFRECLIEASGSQRKAQCAWFPVHENPGAAESERINLFVARLPARRQTKTPLAPMLFISGGPGQGASQSFLHADRDYAPIAKLRDIYLIDQRGTGYSNPLTCPETIRQHTMIHTAYDRERNIRATQQCLDELTHKPLHYTTENTIHDFEQVRRALHVPQWNLLGVSYGTVVAGHYMRRFPEALRSVVIDSAVPPQHILGSEIGLKSQEALDALLSRCQEDTKCNKAMPNLQQNLKQLLTRLQQSAVSLNFEDFKNGKVKQMSLEYGHVAMLIRMYLYNTFSAALLPTMLNEAATEEHYAPIARAVENVANNLQNALATGLHNAVMCTEYIPFLKDSPELIEKNSDSYLGVHTIQSLIDACSVWPVGPVPKDMHDPLISDIPTLVLSGEFDPITPPEYGEQFVKGLSNGKHIVLKGQGHFVSTTGCTPHIVAQFVEQASTTSLNTQCTNRLFSPPVFLNFNGAAP